MNKKIIRDKTIVFIGDSHGWGQGANKWDQSNYDSKVPLINVKSFTNQLKSYLLENGFNNFINSSVGGFSSREIKKILKKRC